MIQDEDIDPFADDSLKAIPTLIQEHFDELCPWSETEILEEANASTTKVIYDSETMAEIDEETGEVVSVTDAPPATGDLIGIASWLGEKLTWIAGKIAGMTAERQVWLDKIASQYDPRIKHYQRLEKYLVASYLPIFETYARGIVFPEGKKPRSKTVKLGLLKMNFTTTRARTDVLKQDEAIELLRAEIAARKAEGDAETAERLKAAIKISRTLLKSAIPTDIRIPLESDEVPLFLDGDDLTRWEAGPVIVTLKEYLEKKGLVSFYAGGEDVFNLG
jgi:hypothetical protein